MQNFAGSVSRLFVYVKKYYQPLNHYQIFAVPKYQYQYGLQKSSISRVVI